MKNKKTVFSTNVGTKPGRAWRESDREQSYWVPRPQHSHEKMINLFFIIIIIIIISYI